MIERLNGRIAEVLATTRFDSAEHFADTIKRYVKVYNQHIPQKALPSGDEKLVPKTAPTVIWRDLTRSTLTDDRTGSLFSTTTVSYTMPLWLAEKVNLRKISY